MSRSIALLLVSTLAFPLLAADVQLPPIFRTGHIELGLRTVRLDSGGLHSDGEGEGSSKFTEYRDVPDGTVLPSLRIEGYEGFRYSVLGQNLTSHDRRMTLNLDFGTFKVGVDGNQIPHRFGFNGHTLESQTTRQKLEVSDTLQRDFQSAIEQRFAADPSGVDYFFLRDVVAPSLAATPPLGLEIGRKRGTFSVATTRATPFDVRLTYVQDNRSGSRPVGGAFGLTNAVELAEPVDYRTRDLLAAVELPIGRGLVRGSLRFVEFAAALPGYAFDNPFRAVSSTDPNAWLAPGPLSAGGPADGRMSLAPDNNTVTAEAGVVYRLPANSRLNAGVTIGRSTQSSRFIPYTSNTAITVPFEAGNPSTLPERALDGEIDTTSIAILFTTRPLKNFSFTSRLRRHEVDNKTPRVAFPGYVPFDAVWNPTPRISVPYGSNSDRWDNVLAWNLGTTTLEAGFRTDSIRRDYRESGKTTENTWRLGVNAHPFTWAAVLSSCERGSRSYDRYDPNASAAASFTDPAASLALQQGLRRPDLAERQVNRCNGILQLMPGEGNLSVSIGYTTTRENYTHLELGLLDAKDDAASLDADYAPGDRWSIYAFAGRESIESNQAGRQSGATLSLDPADDWTALEKTLVDSFGAGVTATIIPAKLDGRITVRYDRADGSIRFSRPVAGQPQPQGIGDLDDSTGLVALAEVSYHLSEAWDLALATWNDNYSVRNAATTGLTNYMPGAFLLAANAGDYQGRVTSLSAIYKW